MTMTEDEKKIKKIMKKTIANMKEISTYKPQFDSTISLYAETKYQYDLLMRQFYESGCKVTEEYTNKAGFTNIRKTAIYLALETLRRDIINHENILGLTPVGLRKINESEMKGKKKKSKLIEALKSIEQNTT
ncbi:terminase [Sporanaerobium hydrogeniformans]|uniref:Terminase n=1 Tax=Sporanaerobium hydrogeniformans TaxID=3072179 RepID=A0AC61DGG6_9FIRM|nr:P27 family phage terminase small subunit [Sporanaerobium hydrogeniformans]PHV71903.1 terminase [Sporanaerobium hydrogeniformans]